MKIDFQSSSTKCLKFTGCVSSLFLIAASTYQIAPTNKAFVAVCTGGAVGVTILAIAAIRGFGKTMELINGCSRSYENN